MPRASVWLIRIALLHLLSGAVLGTAYLVFKATGTPAWVATHRPVHMEQMLVGWMVQLVIGVAWWILPRPAEPERAPRAATMWLVGVLLNGGVVVAALGGSPRLPQALLPAGRMLEVLAVAVFALHAWRRQRPYRQAARRLIV